MFLDDILEELNCVSDDSIPGLKELKEKLERTIMEIDDIYGALKRLKRGRRLIS